MRCERLGADPDALDSYCKKEPSVSGYTHSCLSERRETRLSFPADRRASLYFEWRNVLFSGSGRRQLSALIGSGSPTPGRETFGAPDERHETSARGMRDDDVDVIRLG